MHIEKKKLMNLKGVYVAECLNLGNRRYYAVASEDRGEGAYLIDSDKFQVTPFWRGESGVMNIIQLPFSDKALCIDKFYPVFQSKEAEISILDSVGKNYSEVWNRTPIAQLPFCHRIGVVKGLKENFLIACTLCEDKNFQDDWSMPGSVYLASIDESIKNGEWKFKKIYGGLVKNHGLYIFNDSHLYVASDEGVLYFDFSLYSAGKEIIPIVISDAPTSDLCVCSSDEKIVMATIEPFHGNSVAVYEIDDSKAKLIWTSNISFGHVIWCGNILGEDCVIVGSRGGDRRLELYSIEGKLKSIIDEDVGPTQISVYSTNDGAFILSANHGVGDVSLYHIRK